MSRMPIKVYCWALILCLQLSRRFRWCSTLASSNVTFAPLHFQDPQQQLIPVRGMEHLACDPTWPEERQTRFWATARYGDSSRAPLSNRTPDLPTFMNLADQIERTMIADDHRIWGWVVYRCTYEDDAEWEEWKERFIAQTREDLEYYNGGDLLDSLEITFLEDREQFDNAAAPVIRKHFADWVTENAVSEQHGSPPVQSARYNFCLQVDITSLRSILDAEDDDDDGDDDDDDDNKGSVIIIWRDWQPWNSADMDDDTLEPIDGCIQEDVGWGRFAFTDFSATWYAGLRSEVGWENLSKRPPEVAESL